MADRRQTFRPGDPGRRLMDRIKALDPTILDCGPHCAHFERHSDIDHAYNVTNLLRVRA